MGHYREGGEESTGAMPPLPPRLSTEDSLLQHQPHHRVKPLGQHQGRRGDQQQMQGI